jgi:hypothetical protein
MPGIAHQGLITDCISCTVRPPELRCLCRFRETVDSLPDRVKVRQGLVSLSLRQGQ